MSDSSQPLQSEPSSSSSSNISVTGTLDDGLPALTLPPAIAVGTLEMPRCPIVERATSPKPGISTVALESSVVVGSTSSSLCVSTIPFHHMTLPLQFEPIGWPLPPLPITSSQIQSSVIKPEVDCDVRPTLCGILCGQTLEAIANAQVAHIHFAWEDRDEATQEGQRSCRRCKKQFVYLHLCSFYNVCKPSRLGMSGNSMQFSQLGSPVQGSVKLYQSQGKTGLRPCFTRVDMSHPGKWCVRESTPTLYFVFCDLPDWEEVMLYVSLARVDSDDSHFFHQLHSLDDVVIPPDTGQSKVYFAFVTLKGFHTYSVAFSSLSRGLLMTPWKLQVLCGKPRARDGGTGEAPLHCIIPHHSTRDILHIAFQEGISLEALMHNLLTQEGFREWHAQGFLGCVKRQPDMTPVVMAKLCWAIVGKYGYSAESLRIRVLAILFLKLFYMGLFKECIYNLLFRELTCKLNLLSYGHYWVKVNFRLAAAKLQRNLLKCDGAVWLEAMHSCVDVLEQSLASRCPYVMDTARTLHEEIPYYIAHKPYDVQLSSELQKRLKDLHEKLGQKSLERNEMHAILSGVDIAIFNIMGSPFERPKESECEVVIKCLGFPGCLHSRVCPNPMTLICALMALVVIQLHGVKVPPEVKMPPSEAIREVLDAVCDGFGCLVPNVAHFVVCAFEYQAHRLRNMAVGLPSEGEGSRDGHSADALLPHIPETENLLTLDTVYEALQTLKESTPCIEDAQLSEDIERLIEQLPGVADGHPAASLLNKSHAKDSCGSQMKRRKHHLGAFEYQAYQPERRALDFPSEGGDIRDGHSVDTPLTHDQQSGLEALCNAVDNDMQCDVQLSKGIEKLIDQLSVVVDGHPTASLLNKPPAKGNCGSQAKRRKHHSGAFEHRAHQVEKRAADLPNENESVHDGHSTDASLSHTPTAEQQRGGLEALCDAVEDVPPDVPCTEDVQLSKGIEKLIDQLSVVVDGHPTASLLNKPPAKGNCGSQAKRRKHHSGVLEYQEYQLRNGAAEFPCIDGGIPPDYSVSALLSYAPGTDQQLALEAFCDVFNNDATYMPCMEEQGYQCQEIPCHAAHFVTTRSHGPSIKEEPT